jgi:hypothetical protein
MSPRPKSGLTLVEMLVAMTASLILFGAVVTIFQILGDAVGKSRRAGRLDSDLCSIRTRLQQDLAGATANRSADGLQVEINSGSVSGYFEVIEGANSDLLDYSVSPAYNRATNIAGPTAASNDRIVGDTDDLLLFTTRNVTLDPFVGKFGNTTLTAEQAEVAYFCRPTDGTPAPTNPKLYTLYRRQLLIIGGFPRPPFASDGSMPFTSWGDFYATYDLSARREDLGASGVRIVLNTANDLQRRRNRFAHDPVCSGTTRDLHPLLPNHPNNVLALAGTRQDEDVLATNVLAFDVRMLDPQAVERQRTEDPLTVRMQPADQLYWTKKSNNLATATPVYGDLGFNAFAAFHPDANTAPGVFSGYGRSGNCLVGTATTSRTYDTWTSLYVSNLQDDDNNGMVDDAPERAPYSQPLGGIQVVIRLYDSDTKTVKQATITQSLTQ